MYYVKAIIALLIRLYFGWAFLSAGLEKWQTGFGAKSVTGYLKGGLSQTHSALLAAKGPAAAAHANVTDTWAWLIQNVFIPNAGVFAFLVKTGEVLVGAGLILGLFTHLATCFALLMNFSYLLTGTISSNPQMVLGFLVIFLFGSASYYIGLDNFIIPKLVEKYHVLKERDWLKIFFPVRD